MLRCASKQEATIQLSFGGEPTAALAPRTWRPVVAGPERRARKRIGSAKAAFRPYRRPALIERRIAAVLGAVPRVGRAPASAGPGRLAPLRARPALGVSVGEQQSHYCDTEQNKTGRAHGSSPSPSFRSDLRCKNGVVCEASATKASYLICVVLLARYRWRVNMSKFLLTVCAFGLLLSSAFAEEKSPEQHREESNQIGLQKMNWTRVVAS